MEHPPCMPSVSFYPALSFSPSPSIFFRKFPSWLENIALFEFVRLSSLHHFPARNSQDSRRLHIHLRRILH